MPALKADVIGVEKTQLYFNNIKGDFEAWRLVEIVNFCLKKIEDEAKAAAPVVTGFLRDSISSMMITENFPTIAGECFVSAPYAASIENGYISRAGNRVPARRFFTPAAIRGQVLFRKMITDYIREAITTGKLINPPSVTRGKGKSTKFQFKQRTGSGTRYKYGPDRFTVSKFNFLRKPGGRKQPSTRFQRPKAGSSGVRR